MKQSEEIQDLYNKLKAINKQQKYQDSFEKVEFKVNSYDNYYHINLNDRTICRYDNRLYTKEEVEDIASRFQRGLMYLADQQYIDLKKKIEKIENSFELEVNDE